MNKKRILDTLIVLLLGVIAFSGYKLYGISQDAKASKQQYRQLEDTVQTETEQTGPISSYDKYNAVYQQNNDFVGWIYIPDTVLSYPVMHTPSVPEYYLRKDFTKKYSIAGVPFVDYKCVIDQSDNTIVYGHNMMNGTMFSIIENYMKQAYWQQHRFIGFDTLQDYGTYEVAICGKIDLMNTEFDYISTVDFDSQQEFDDYIAQAQALAAFDTGVQLEYGDKLLLISTCQTNYADGRCIVIAKKISNEDLSKADI